MAPFVDHNHGKSSKNVTTKYAAGTMKYVIFIILMVFICGNLMIFDHKNVHVLPNISQLHAIIGFVFTALKRTAEISVKCEIHFKLLIDGVLKMDLYDAPSDEQYPKRTDGFLNYW